jgi:hypothetical protein
MGDCVEQEALWNQVLPIGGPGEAMTALQQGEMLFKLLDKEPKFIKVRLCMHASAPTRNCLRKGGVEVA